MHALPFRHLERVELDITIAEPDPEDQVAAPDHIERRDALRDFHRVVKAREDDADDARHRPGVGGEPREEGNQLQLTDALAQIMLPGTDGVPAAVAGEACHRELPVERRDHVAADGMLIREEDPDLHAPG